MARAEVSPGPECPSYAWQVEHVPAYGRRMSGAIRAPSVCPCLRSGRVSRVLLYPQAWRISWGLYVVAIAGWDAVLAGANPVRR
jgi:hypothetical protein